jgi:ornithine racemase
MLPQLVVDIRKIRENAAAVVRLGQTQGVSIVGVTKGFAAIPAVAKALVESGVDGLADSRTENLIRLEAIPAPKLLLRLPSLSRVDEVVRLADMSLNSEIDTVKALSAAARAAGRRHKVLLMIELGDGREGVPEEAALDTARLMARMPGIEFAGLGANFTCFGGVLPTRDSLGRLVAIGRAVEESCGGDSTVISGGSSSSFHLLENGELPAGITSLRLGEVLLLGRETAFGRRVPWLHGDAFTLRAEIIELQRKNSLPSGPIGADAFGESRSFRDRGTRLRALLALGRQDAAPEYLVPREKGAEVLGASSDHLVLDLSDASEGWQVGDVLEFDVSYGALLSLANSACVEKSLVDEKS